MSLGVAARDAPPGSRRFAAEPRSASRPLGLRSLTRSLSRRGLAEANIPIVVRVDDATVCRHKCQPFRASAKAVGRIAFE